MDRPVPTDPPDEPVNRIAEFMEQIEARQQVQKGSLAGLFVGPQLGLDTSTQAILLRALETLQERYEKEPFPPASLKPLLKVLLKVRSYESVITFGQWLQSVSPEEDPEINALMAEAQKRLDEQGPA